MKEPGVRKVVVAVSRMVLTTFPCSRTSFRRIDPCDRRCARIHTSRTCQRLTYIRSFQVNINVETHEMVDIGPLPAEKQDGEWSHAVSSESLHEKADGAVTYAV